MLSVRRPSLLNRALTTPPLTPTSPHLEPMPPKADTSTNLLTPPLSPRNSRSSSDLFGLDDTLTSTTTCSPEANRNNMDLDSQQDGALICPFDVEIIQNPRGRDQMFGSGAWSNVYKATPIRPRPNVDSVGLPTPPASPTVAMPIIVAVKQSARPDAKPILENEARILSFLGRLAPKRKPFVTFYGIIESSSSLVLEAIPLSLEDHLYCHAVSAKHSLTTSNISDPVVGSATLWLSLAQELVAALSWLHNVAEVVHGDIKPGNFLLQPRGNLDNNEFAFRPLFIDFSSSHRIDHSNNEIPAGTLSAVTREYTAPELLKSSVLRNPKSTATKASDVFSLAITLLVAATGNLMVYDGSVFQRQAMATQGWQAIGLARCGSNGSRVPRQGVVERTLDKAVLKHDMGRITASKWLELVEEMQKGGPTKEPREDGFCRPETYIELFDTFHAAWKIHRDLGTIVLKLNIEKALLIQWAQQSVLTTAIDNEHDQLQWASRSKDKFASLTKELGYFVSRLRQLFPASDHQARAMFKEDLHSICSVAFGQQLQKAVTGTVQADANREHVQLLKRRQRVLDCLWFRRIRDRYDTLTPSNTDAFEWMLADKVDMKNLQWSSITAWLQGNSCSPYWICGKDEFSGQPDVIVDVVRQLADLPNVNLIVSCRPINSCYDAFSRGPRLQLQDLTRNDIAKYIDDTIGSRAHMSRHQRVNPQLFPRLRTQLVEKATGVFLWLDLVCQQLSTALSDGESWDAVQRLADQMPLGLELLFERMLGKITPLDRQWAFRILRAATKISTE